MLIKIIITVLVGSLGYQIAKKLNIPSAPMIGSMVAVGIFNVFTDMATMPVTIKIFTQGIAGTFIGMRMSIDDLKNGKRLIKPIVLLCSLLTINTFATGFIIHTFCGFDLMTSLLSCVSGGVTDISLAAMDLGAEPAVVAILQTSRMVSTLAFFPAWIIFFTGKDEELNNQKAEEAKKDKANESNKWKKTTISLSVAFVLSYLGRLAGIPAGSLVFAMFGIMILNCTTDQVYVEKNIRTIGKVFAGALVGSTIKQSTVMAIPRLFVPILLLIGGYFTVNFIFGQIASRANMMDKRTAMFAACPAGASDMAMIAGDLGADLAKIGLIQVIRLVYAVAIMPQLILLVTKFL